MDIIIRKGKHLYKEGMAWRLAGDPWHNASLLSFLAGLLRGTPCFGEGELRKTLCSFPNAGPTALGVGAVALDCAVPMRQEDNATKATGEAAAADCSGRPRHYCPSRLLPSRPSALGCLCLRALPPGPSEGVHSLHGETFLESFRTLLIVVLI